MEVCAKPSKHILSYGAGVQSTALVCMSCENALQGASRHPAVPIYDAVIFADLGLEPPWVYEQLDIARFACRMAGIPFYVVDAPLFADYMKFFGKKVMRSVPFWTVGPDGNEARMPRQCTITYKIEKVQRHAKYTTLDYRARQRMRPEDNRAHWMHLGFSAEETHRCRSYTYEKRMKKYEKELFNFTFPLIEMGLTRADNYKYLLEKWNIDAKGSACCFCPYHTDYFYQHLRKYYPDYYKQVVQFERVLEERQPKSKIKSKLFLSKSRRRVVDLRPEECVDAEYFTYNDRLVWNGF